MEITYFSEDSTTTTEDTMSESQSQSSEVKSRENIHQPLTITAPKKLSSLHNLRKTTSMDKVKRKVVKSSQSHPQFNMIDSERKKTASRIPVGKYVMSFHQDVIAHCGQISNPKAEDRMAFGHFRFNVNFLVAC